MLHIELFGYTLTIKKKAEKVRKTDFTVNIDQSKRNAEVDKVLDCLGDDFLARAKALRAERQS